MGSDARPGIPCVEGRGEIVYGFEVFDPVALLSHEQTGVDEKEHNAPDVFSALDAPMRQHLSSHQTELLERKIPTRAGQLLPGDMAPHGPLSLTILEGREHKEIRPVLIALIELSDAFEDVLG
jgi:hypothetical protein